MKQMPADNTTGVALLQTSARVWLLRAIQALAVACAFLLILPYLLTPLYRAIDPVSTLMLWRWATGAPVERAVTPIDVLASPLPRTVIAAEDAGFCSHHGIDFGELRGALERDEVRPNRGGIHESVGF
jgi:monofunctional glycosyltransferase